LWPKKHVTFLECFLINLDTWPWSAICRVALGLGIPPVFGTLSGSRDGVLDLLGLAHWIVTRAARSPSGAAAFFAIDASRVPSMAWEFFTDDEFCHR
jgi:hypothetical protein